MTNHIQTKPKELPVYPAKKRAEVVLIDIPGANGHVTSCHIPTEAVVRYGLSRLLSGQTNVSNVISKYKISTGE